jgi:four helix bundle protein
MTAKSYRDLVCWQLSATLRKEVNAVLARSWHQVDRRLREDCAAATRSAANNISEGFGRSDAAFARHLDIALGSLQETENHLDELLEREFLTLIEHQELRRQAKRASVATGRLFQYLNPGYRRRSRKRSEAGRPDPT